MCVQLLGRRETCDSFWGAWDQRYSSKVREVVFGGKRLAGNCNKNELCGGDGGGSKSAKIGRKLPRGNSKGLFSNVASNLLTTAI